MLIILKNMIVNLDNIRTIDKITVQEDFGLKLDMDETYVDYFFKNEYERDLAFVTIIKCKTDQFECCHLDS